MKPKTKSKRKIICKVKRITKRKVKRINPQQSILYQYGNLRGLVHQLKILAGIGEPTNIKMSLPSEKDFKNEFKEFTEGFIDGMKEAKLIYKTIPKYGIENYIQDLTDESKMLEFEIKQKL